MSHYFVNDDSVNHHQKEIHYSVFGHSFKFITDNGVFSKDNVDFGTKLLIDQLSMGDLKGSMLDIGCGYGPIGITVSALADVNVDVVDVNERALELAKHNAQLNNSRVNIFMSDRYNNVFNKYNYIITNPPIRAGNKILYDILLGAKDYLKPDGELWFVIRKQQGAKTIINNLSDTYQTAIIEQKKGYYILRCKTKL